MMRTIPTRTRCTRPHNLAAHRHTQAGVALITSLLFLIMLTLLALPLLRGFGLEEKIAGNTREKERAFQAAENALGYVEWWLVKNQPTDGIDCRNSQPVAVNDVRICNAGNLALIDRANPVDWQGQGGTEYAPQGLTVGTGGTNNAAFSNEDVNYKSIPGLYVAYLDASHDNAETFYSITSAGYGGGRDTAAVTQSVFKLYYATKSLNGP